MRGVVGLTTWRPAGQGQTLEEEAKVRAHTAGIVPPCAGVGNQEGLGSNSNLKASHIKVQFIRGSWLVNDCLLCRDERERSSFLP